MPSHLLARLSAYSLMPDLRASSRARAEGIGKLLEAYGYSLNSVPIACTSPGRARPSFCRR
jgi:hypothetical protein